MAELLSDYDIQQIHDGLLIPYAETVARMKVELLCHGESIECLTPQQMAREIRKCRGVKDPDLA